jgi:hypothetical protein
VIAGGLQAAIAARMAKQRNAIGPSAQRLPGRSGNNNNNNDDDDDDDWL